MHSGCLVAIGSAQHIKSRYGEGYTLTFTITDSSIGDDLVNEVRSVFPNAVLRTIQNSTHMVWHLARSDSDRWSELFAKARNLADSKSWITDYSLAQATLEEAFLRLSQANESDVAQQTVVSITASSTSPRADGL
ncbi:unnamed protein product [Anisakis simplex]|uniref:ABC transporter ATP-binding protein n=1 Tax=Anisakis simplex TaxID=6269 RepID=A0A0M3K9W6_ANISI|nr:unnamed protein product [Anisakis simplex]